MKHSQLCIYVHVCIDTHMTGSSLLKYLTTLIQKQSITIFFYMYICIELSRRIYIYKYKYAYRCEVFYKILKLNGRRWDNHLLNAVMVLVIFVTTIKPTEITWMKIRIFTRSKFNTL